MKENETPQQLTLLPRPTAQTSSKVPLQFRLDEATRRRGLQHVAELRRLLAARQAAKATEHQEATVGGTVGSPAGGVSTPSSRRGGGGRERPHGVPMLELRIERQDGERARRHPVVEVLLDTCPARRRVAVHDQVVHRLVGDRRQRRLAVAGPPRRPTSVRTPRPGRATRGRRRRRARSCRRRSRSGRPRAPCRSDRSGTRRCAPRSRALRRRRRRSRCPPPAARRSPRAS